jgi:ubiquinone/menaquinone biosynthesis C-methylase UbiE
MYQAIEDTGRPATLDYSRAEEVPEYLMQHYWWAYVHPRAVQFFDHPWIINLILLGNYRKLRDAALAEFAQVPLGRVLQVSCAYGNLTVKLAKVAAQSGLLDVVDVLPIQLKNLKWKMPARTPVRLIRMDSTDLKMADAHYDSVLLFFLLHEQPAEVRARTLAQAFRVLKPGGKVVIVDFARPFWWNPLRYLWRLFLAVFEPFALDLWDKTLSLPPDATVVRTTYFGGLYQKLVVMR